MERSQTMRRELVGRSLALSRALGVSALRAESCRRLVPALALASEAELERWGARVGWLLETILHDVPVAGRA